MTSNNFLMALPDSVHDYELLKWLFAVCNDISVDKIKNEIGK
jgi:hypothetical protein